MIQGDFLFGIRSVKNPFMDNIKRRPKIVSPLNLNLMNKYQL